MGDEAVERCVRDALADHARQGGLVADDVHRLIAAHRLEPGQAILVQQKLSARGIDVDDADEHDTGALADATLNTPIMVGLRRARLLTVEEEVQLGRRISLGQRAATLLAAETDSTGDFARVVTDGVEARQRLIMSNIRLVISIARRHLGRGLDLDDLIQEGIFGLARAADKFDHTLGYKFSTYATWWIRQAIDRGLANTSRLIRLPVHYVELVNKVTRAQWALSHRLDRTPTLRELAHAVELDQAVVQAALDHAQRPLSIDATRTTGDGTLEHLLPHPGTSLENDVIDAYIRKEIHDRLRRFEDRHFRPKQRISGVEVLRRRYGLTEDGRVWTLEEIGADVGVTRERIRQIQQKALANPAIRALFADLHHEAEAA